VVSASIEHFYQPSISFFHQFNGRNLMMNGIDAMKDTDRTRELAIKSRRAENEEVAVSVTDTGVGPPQQAEHMFNAFFTTKPDGTSMGLRISRSIIESHGGRLWAADNSPRGASFYFTLPIKVEPMHDARRRFRGDRHSGSATRRWTQ
jgi:signal transduction histidine kinase